MPKKKSKKKGSKKQRHVEEEETIVTPTDLPQVWLQVDTLERNNDEVAQKKKHVTIQLTAEDNLEPPLPEEQDQLAQYWALEEVNEPKGWQEDEELDYTQVASSLGIPLLPEGLSTGPVGPVRPVLQLQPLEQEECGSIGEATRQQNDRDLEDSEVMRRESHVSSIRTPPPESETHSLFNYAQSSIYFVQHLGELHSVTNEWVESPDPNNVLKLIELAQRQGNIPWTSQSGSDRLLIVSKYGIKVTDTNKQRVYSRHTLHNIVNIIHYLNTHGQSVLVVKIQTDISANFDLYIYECQNESQATEICVMLGQAFDVVLNKIKMDNNLRGLC